jgi:hypothetical protein
VATTGTSPSKPPQRAALDILRGRSKRRRRKHPTVSELANERRVFDELVELMEVGVLVDRSELVPLLADNEELPSTRQPLLEQLALLFEVGDEPFCAGCLWHWHRSCGREGCWLAEFARTKCERSA